MKRVVAALSGGVDSSVAAALLVGEGYQVEGVMLQLWAEPCGGEGGANRCCTPEAVERAREVADLLGIPFQLLDTRELFREAVVDHLVSEYAAARTPNPCVRCNRDVRFGFMLDWALQRGAEMIATGHYARVEQGPDGYRLLRGLDSGKDQSYVLHILSQHQLARVIFPLGELHKDQVRTMARERGLPVWDQPESQDICFLADGDYRRFLSEHAPELSQPGPILDTAGRLLGQHSGLANYTIGQRKGIGLAVPDPLYVVALDPTRNTLIVGSQDEVVQDECEVSHMHYVSGGTYDEPFEALAQVRYRHQAVPALATPLSETRVRVRFESPQRAVTPGQYLVLYDGDLVIGGGVICAQ